MGKHKSADLLFLLLSIVCVFCGCSRQEEQISPACTVVTRIVLSRQDGVTRSYTQSEKMEKILDYLRLADPYGLPEDDPEQISGHSYQITVYCSDGRQKSYRQKADLYMIRDGGHWQKIKKGVGQQIDELLTLPGD